MQIESVQAGRARDVPSGAGAIHTGIDKRPLATITIETGGVVGDAIVDTDDHGGADQAVYLYARADYRVFEEALETDLAGGSFGENVTIDTWDLDPIRVGDRFDFDDVVLEVTAPRVPCATFAARMAELVGREKAAGWVKRFAAERRPGWYCRVLAPGTVSAGLQAVVVPASAEHITGLELYDLYYAAVPDRDIVARALASPVAERTRQWLGRIADQQ